MLPELVIDREVAGQPPVAFLEVLERHSVSPFPALSNRSSQSARYEGELLQSYPSSVLVVADAQNYRRSSGPLKAEVEFLPGGYLGYRGSERGTVFVISPRRRPQAGVRH